MGNSFGKLPPVQSTERPGQNPAGEGLPRSRYENPLPIDGKFGRNVDNLFVQFERSAKMYPTNACGE